MKTMTIYMESDMYGVAITMEIGVNETKRISQVMNREWNSRGIANPCRSWVWVPAGMGTGHDGDTSQLSNKSKNIFFGPKLREIL